MSGRAGVWSGPQKRGVIEVRLPGFLAAFLIVPLLCLVGLAGLAVYNLVSNGAAITAGNGDRLAYLASSQRREQNLQHQVELDAQRLHDLEKENQERETEVARLEVNLGDLGNTLAGLKVKATSFSTRVGNGPQPVAKNGGTLASSAVITSGNSISGAYSNYYTQLQQLETQLSSLNQSLNEKKVGLDSLQQSFNDYNAELVRLTGKEPDLPGAISNLRDAQALRPPDSLPGDGLLTSPFGWRDSPFHPGTRGWHDGVDVACNFGQPVRATKAGIVTFATMDRNGYGLRVDINHENGWLTFYGHNSQILVRVGQSVNKGDVIGLCGSTGASTGPHIHYGLHFNGAMIDPLRYITVPYHWA